MCLAFDGNNIGYVTALCSVIILSIFSLSRNTGYFPSFMSLILSVFFFGFQPIHLSFIRIKLIPTFLKLF